MSKKIVAPAILSDTQDGYNSQLQLAIGFANRVHIDISDGIFSPHATVPPKALWWPAGVQADIHVMYQKPDSIMGELIALKPRLIIVHAEAEGDFIALAERLHSHGIKAGLALLPQTPVAYVAPGVGHIDHITIFSGDLGSYGGKVNFGLLKKAAEIHALDSGIEIGWDGGISDKTIKKVADAGIDVLVSGGYIAHAKNPPHAYRQLKRQLA